MTLFSCWRLLRAVPPRWLMGLFLGCGCLMEGTASAQAPTWALAVADPTSPLLGSSSISAIATANGSVFVTGYFSGTIALGSLTLTSAGNRDLFVAKYVPGTGTWAWARRGGGTSADNGMGIAVTGTSVYVTGSVFNDLTNSTGATISGPAAPTTPLLGATSTSSGDLLVAKFTDNGASATLDWLQTGGGQGEDRGYAIAVSGPNVYVTGRLSNDRTNSFGVVFGGTGPGSASQYGTAATVTGDIVVAKYIDQGATATLAWTQVGGGNNEDMGYGLAVSGTSVYVTGYLTNDTANSTNVVFGGTGATAGSLPQYGAGSASDRDLFVAKYIDNGASATLGWTQVGGGTSGDQGYGIAANGLSVYVTGYIRNNTANGANVVFGGSGTAPGTAPQLGTTSTSALALVVAKYTDNGTSATLGWTQVGGGSGTNTGWSIATTGASVYVVGGLTNDGANSLGAVFGGAGTTLGTVGQAGASAVVSYDLLVAKYTDNGASATLNWTQVGGGPDFDAGAGIALNGSQVYVAGTAGPPATFGNLVVGGALGSSTYFLGAVSPSGALATLPGTSLSTLQLYPNPTSGPALLTGAPAGVTVQVFDVLGRAVAIATATTTGTVPLPAGLTPGLYLVRAGTKTLRWTVK